jgi:hypothetical protein
VLAACESALRGFAEAIYAREGLQGHAEDELRNYMRPKKVIGSRRPPLGKLTKLKEDPMGKNPNWVEIVDIP